MLQFPIFLYDFLEKPFLFFCNRVPKHKFKNRETLNTKIGALCVVAACSQFVKHNRKYSRVSNTNTRKRKCWVKL